MKHAPSIFTRIYVGGAAGDHRPVMLAWPGRDSRADGDLPAEDF